MITNLREVFQFPSVYGIEALIIYFIFYSFCGWLIECAGEVIANKRFINRGFLVGPYCPIHGTGALLITLLLNGYSQNKIVVFFLSILICGTLEYLTSYIMEKVFKARWWDYSDKRFNINGRICLEMLGAFGIAGVVIVCVLNKVVLYIISKIPTNLRHVIAICLAIIFFIDLIFSCNILTHIDLGIEKIKEDSTSIIREKIQEFTKNGKNIKYKVIEALSFANK